MCFSKKFRNGFNRKNKDICAKTAGTTMRLQKMNILKK